MPKGLTRYIGLLRKELLRRKHLCFNCGAVIPNGEPIYPGPDGCYDDDWCLDCYCAFCSKELNTDYAAYFLALVKGEELPESPWGTGEIWEAEQALRLKKMQAKEEEAK